MGPNWSVKRDKRERPLSPWPSARGRQPGPSPAVTAEAMAGEVPPGGCHDPTGEAATRDLAKAEQRFAHANAAGAHLSPNICRCSPANSTYFSPQTPSFTFQFRLWAGAGPETCRWMKNSPNLPPPRAGSSPAPTPVTAEVAVSLFYVIPAAPGAPGSRRAGVGQDRGEPGQGGGSSAEGRKGGGSYPYS